MKVLHICNCYMRSKVHVELYRKLEERQIEQIIYVPESDSFDPQTNAINSKIVKIVYSKLLRPYHRILWRTKIKRIVNDIKNKIDIQDDLTCIHASTFFSDGAVALKLKEEYKIPIVLAVRGTDVNLFLQIPVFWPLLRKLVKNADKIVFITPCIQKKFIRSVALYDLIDVVKNKSIIIPNGVNKYWIDNHSLIKPSCQHRIIYVGRMMKNKNIGILIESILKLKKDIPDIHLDLVGDGEEVHHIMDIIRDNKDTIDYHGKISDKSKLSEILRNNNLFVMISRKETFGLVYVEALSQGLNVLYTKNQGIDGLFSDDIGERTSPNNINEICSKINMMLNHPERYRCLTIDEMSDFDWEHIASKYIKIYDSL